jgi:type VI secretion system protein ImpF
MSTRVRSPVTQAFRKAFKERDKGLTAKAPEPGSEAVIAGRLSLGRASISERDLHDVVATELSGLMNTVNFAAGTDLSAYPEVRTSILNFGFPDMIHRSIDESGVDDIGDELAWVLATFEPRLVKASIRVSRDRQIDPDSQKLRFAVTADLDSEPLKLPVQFLADLERDTGRIVIQRR